MSTTALDIDFLDLGRVSSRVVSMPCIERFAELAPERRDEVLAPGLPTLAVEGFIPRNVAARANTLSRESQS